MAEASEALSTLSKHEWQRLPKAAIMTMYVNSVQKFVRENLFVFFGAGTGFALSDWFGLRELFMIAVFLLLGGLLVAIIYHRRFQYQIDDKNIRVRKGFFERKELKVPFDRVQTTSMSQPVYMKPLGLTRFSLQTPGAAVTEVTLPGMPIDQAEILRDLIAAVQYRGKPVEQADSSDAAIEQGRTADSHSAVKLFEAGPLDLFMYGLTSNQIWIMIGFLIGPLLGVLGDRIDASIEWMQGLAIFQALSLYDSPLLIVLVVLIVLIVFGGLLMILSGLLAVVRFYSYSLTLQSDGSEQPDGFKSRFGLLERREKTLKKVKLHSLEMIQTALGRAIGRWHIVGHQTGMNVAGGTDMKFLVPGVDDERIVELASSIDELNMPTAQQWQPIDPLLQRILSVRISAVMIGLALLLQYLLTEHVIQMDVISIIVLCANMLLLFLIHLRCRRWGYMQENAMLMIRRGLIGQSIMRFRLQSCQQVRVTRSTLQRRRGLASLHIRLPHGEVVIPWIRSEQADAMANLLLYRIEAGTAYAL